MTKKEKYNMLSDIEESLIMRLEYLVNQSKVDTNGHWSVDRLCKLSETLHNVMLSRKELLED